MNVGFNTATAVTLTGTDPDVPALALTYTVTATPAHGTLSGIAPNLTFTPAAGFNGADSLQFTVKNTANNTSAAATVTLNVAAGVPTANAQSVNVAFNTATAITLTASDPDIPPLMLTYAVTVNPVNGSLSGTAPNLTYTPAPGHNGADSFKFTAMNTGGKTSIAATVSLTVAPGVPTANAQSINVVFNTANAVTLTGTDPDVPALALTYTVTANPIHGTLSGTAPNLTYTPAAGYTGSDSLQFTVKNTANNTSPAAAISLTVAPGTPTANAQSVNVAFNTATAITLTGSDPNVPPLSLTFTTASTPLHGTLTGTAPNLTYTPSNGYNGPDSFNFIVTNSANRSSGLTQVSLTVAAGAPVAIAQSVNVAFNAGTPITLAGSDPNVNPLTPLVFTVTANPAHGTLSGSNQNLTYTPTAGFNGTDSFQFTVKNTANLTSPAATVSLTVAVGVPTANAQSPNVPFNTATTITLTGSDPNVPALTPLTYTLTANPSNGALSGTAPNLTYTPTTGFNGADSFQFTVKNSGNQTSSAATVSLTVAAGVPTANAQSVNVGFNTVTGITLTATDPDIPALTLNYNVTVASTHGNLSAGNQQNLTYTPIAGYNGADSFKFTATNTAGKTSAAVTVSLTVAAGTPTANAQSVNVAFNSATAVTLTGTDPDVPALVLTYTVTANPAHGSLSGVAPNLSFTPTTGFNGADSFQFTVKNTANQTSSAATVSLTVAAGVPSANAQPVNVAFNTATAITLTATDPDIPPLTLSYTVFLNPSHGSISGTAPNLTYTPTAGYNGTDAFQFTATNTGNKTSNPTAVALTVAAGVPTANAQAVNVNFNTATAVTLTGSDPDVPALSLTYAVTANQMHGTLSGTAPNLTYTPSAGFNGADSFQFTAKNSANNVSTAATVSLTVAASVPTANAQSVNVAFNTATAITLTGSDPNVPAQTLSYTISTNPAHGSLSGTAPGLTYTPTDGYNGADTFQFTVTNTSNKTSSAATVTLTVAAGTPTADAQSAIVPINTGILITLTGSDPDVPALTLTYSVTANPTHGFLSGTAPNLSYSPSPNYSGPDSFQFTVNNSANHTSSAATVSLTVEFAPPTANAQAVNVAFNTGTAITLTGSDPNTPPQTPLTFAVTANPSHGSLSGTAPNLTYTPTTGHNGADSFQFTATNTGNKTSNPATVSLTVAAGTPTANAQSSDVAFNTPTAITLTGSDPNIPALALTYAVTANPAHGTLSGSAPNLTYTPVSGYTGADSLQFTVTNTANLTSSAATVSITVKPQPPPVFTSDPSATPNPATVAQSISFTAAATGTGTLTYAWDFKDGSNGSGASLSHTYAAPGTYVVMVTVNDGVNPGVSKTVSVIVNAAVAIVGSGPDSDGDGFSDSFETAAGTNPNDASSTPTAHPITAAGLQPLTLSKPSIKLNFAKKPLDAIAFAGTLAIPAGFNPNGAKVYFDVGGVSAVLMLTAKGSAVSGGNSIKIAIKATKGIVAAQTAKYTVSFKKGDFSAALASAGLTNANAKAKSVTVTFTVIFNNIVLQSTKTLSYTAKAGKTGAAK